ncbi:Exfoliative toxin A precursor [bacterium YEK0313]|nr:Exfoliative toxin A precursor [bacterium YEK0313]
MCVFTPRLGYVQRQMRALSAVCRVDIDGRAEGTGFLVGPNLVLTNHHVLLLAEALVGGDKALRKPVSCRFDVDRRDDGSISPGKPVAVRACLAFSPASAWEYGVPGAADEPTLDELDYALLELEAPVSEDMTAFGQRRGWIGLPARQPVIARERVYVVQHPAGEPAAINAQGEGVLGFLSNGLKNRLIYSPVAMPGSSGSPCFNDSWELIAMHNWGGKDYRRGVPIGLIQTALQAEGFGPALAPMNAQSAFDRLHDQLNALRRTAEDDAAVKRLLEDSAEILEGLSETLARLHIYKELHEFLHNVQTGTLPPLIACVPASGEPRVNELVALADDLSVKIDEPREQAQKLPLAGARGSVAQLQWLEDMARTAAALSGKPQDEPRSKVLRIRRIVRTQMQMLNESLRGEADRIDFNGMHRLLTSAVRAGALAGTAGARQIELDAEVVIQIRDDLNRRVHQHGEWQASENDQMVLEDHVRDDAIQAPDMFVERWAPTLQQIRLLCDADLSSTLLTELVGYGDELDRSIADGRWSDTPRLFGNFRRRTMRAFWFVDRDLLDRARQMSQLGAPMKALLAFAQDT